MRCIQRFSILILVLVLTGPVRIAAQEQLDTLRVGVPPGEQPLTEALEALSIRYGLRFYTPAGVLDGISVSAPESSAPLPGLLDRLLAGTSLDYLFYRDQAVVIGDREALAADYGGDYYEALEEALAKPADTLAQAVPRIVIGELKNLAADGRALLSGRVTDRVSGEPLIGATLYFPRQQEGAATDEEGAYAIALPTGAHQLEVQSVGYAPLTLSLEIYEDGELPLELTSQSTNLQEVIVEGVY